MADIVLHVVIGNEIESCANFTFEQAPGAVDQASESFGVGDDITAAVEVFDGADVAVESGGIEDGKGRWNMGDDVVVVDKAEDFAFDMAAELTGEGAIADSGLAKGVHACQLNAIVR